ncbi:MAG TPA: FKBP-type peptidyl-prolyl cis-trans isomerase, partial [Parvularculaceae bacterium]|nr:FKBP-type peptidyl-prolyl cis-trans isomerase [Parvularculaceae bacterium]
KPAEVAVNDSAPQAGEAAVAQTDMAQDAAKDAAKDAADNLAASEKFLGDNAKRDGVKTTASGLQYMVLSNGPAGGPSPKASDRVTVDYVGTLTDGVEFDSSKAHGASATFELDHVIPGWTEGVQLMHVGDKYRFFIPPNLAYGEKGVGPIGPNQALIFDVDLLKVSNAEINAKEAADFLAANAKKPGIMKTKSGLEYEVISKGPAGGKQPTDANVVKVNYKGTLVDGTEFDSSYARGEPAEFPLGEVIPGWTEGVQLMHVGDKYRFFIPPDLAYGENGAGPIGPNEALIFEVELLDVK